VTATAALITWVLNGALGLGMLLRWLAGHRARPGPSSFPPPLVFGHLATASVGLALWVVYLSTGRPAALAWLTFILLNVNNGLGDAVLTRGWRHRHSRGGESAARSTAGAYLRAAGEALSGRRPLTTIHGLLGGATFVLVFLAALGVGT
jgi:hypothetical protein